MAKETKFQREVRQAEERVALVARVESERANYLSRMMLALEAAVKCGFALEVKEGKFVLYDRNDRDHELTYLSVMYSESSQDKLSDFEWKVDCRSREEAEAERKFMVKQAALAKLSKEEKELLGV